MKRFKFFQKEKLDERPTALFNADTPEGHMYRRQLYHTQRDLYERLRNNDMDRYYYDRELGRFETIERRPEITQEAIRRINGGITVNECFPEYYHSVGFEFVGVSQIMFDSNSLSPCKFMMFRCRNTGVVVQGEMIYDNHPMWDYNTI